jgi:hypothetical protein
MTSRSILPRSAEFIGHDGEARTIEKQMDEFELIRWLDVLVGTGKILRWQTILWSGNAPVFYMIDTRLYKREDAVSLVRHFEMGNAA